MKLRVLPLLLFATLLTPAQEASAQTVHRCVGADGRSVYSDQPCHALGAVTRQAPRRPAAASVHGFTTGTGTVAPGCSRSLEGLLMGVRGALEARDVNRLATHYHWAGTSSRGGRRLMDELETIAKRPLMAIDFSYPESEAALPEGFEFGPSGPQAYVAPTPVPTQPDAAGASNSSEQSPVGGSEPQAPRPRRPQSLHIEQASSIDDAGAQRTDFHLRRHAGCWWIEL